MTALASPLRSIIRRDTMVVDWTFVPERRGGAQDRTDGSATRRPCCAQVATVQSSDQGIVAPRLAFSAATMLAIASGGITHAEVLPIWREVSIPGDVLRFRRSGASLSSTLGKRPVAMARMFWGSLRSRTREIVRVARDR